jgi:hypothetical protein
MPRCATPAALLPLVFLLAACGGGTAPDADVAVTNATVVDVETGDLRSDRTVFLAGNRIVRIASTEAIEPADSTRIVDATGRYVIPGLWDAHVHSATNADWHFPLLVAHGVTSVRNMHTTVDTALELTNRLRREVASGERPAPRFLANGPIIDGYPPSWPGALVARTADEGRTLVDSLAAGGADFIKVYDNLTPDAYRGITAEAEKIGIPVDGHMPFLVPPEDGAAAGQRTVEHTSGINLGCSTAADSLRGEYRSYLERLPSMQFPESLMSFFSLVRAAGETRDPELCAETARAYAEAGAAVVPTLMIGVSDAEAERLVADSALMAMLPAAVRGQWRGMVASGPGPIAAVMEGAPWQAPKNTEILKEAGVPILAGTDLGNPFLVPGASLHEELRLLVDEAGLSPLEALRAATIAPARTFGLADSLGTVAEGHLADLVLLTANPLEDIGAVDSIDAVVLNGRYLDRSVLDEMLAEAAEWEPASGD